MATVVDNELGIEPLHGPLLPITQIGQAIVKSVKLTVPEFDTFRAHQKASPKWGAGYLSRSKLRLVFEKSPHENSP